MTHDCRKQVRRLVRQKCPCRNCGLQGPMITRNNVFLHLRKWGRMPPPPSQVTEISASRPPPIAPRRQIHTCSSCLGTHESKLEYQLCTRYPGDPLEASEAEEPIVTDDNKGDREGPFFLSPNSISVIYPSHIRYISVIISVIIFCHNIRYITVIISVLYL